MSIFTTFSIRFTKKMFQDAVLRPTTHLSILSDLPHKSYAFKKPRMRKYQTIYCISPESLAQQRTKMAVSLGYLALCALNVKFFMAGMVWKYLALSGVLLNFEWVSPNISPTSRNER